MLTALSHSDRRLTRREILGVTGLVAFPFLNLAKSIRGQESTANASNRPSRIVLDMPNSAPIMVTPEGKDAGDLFKSPDLRTVAKALSIRPPLPWGFRLSPDGKRMAFGAFHGAGKNEIKSKLYVANEQGAAWSDLEVDDRFSFDAISWSASGDQLAVTGRKWLPFRSLGDQGEVEIRHWIIDVKTKQKTELDLSAKQLVAKHSAICDWSPDGKWFLVFEQLGKGKTQLKMVRTDLTESRLVSGPDQGAGPGRFSADGRHVLYVAAGPKNTSGLFIADTKGGAPRQLTQELNAQISGFSWSPDGKRIAYAWARFDPEGTNEQEIEIFLIITDPEGKNPVTLKTDKRNHKFARSFAVLDWR